MEKPDISSMTQDELRHAVAEAIGWKFNIMGYPPNYPGDLNEAWRLFPASVRIDLRRMDDGSHQLRVTDIAHKIDTFWQSDTAARTVCVAYLIWRSWVKEFDSCHT